jgi:hypothetical protein
MRDGGCDLKCRCGIGSMVWRYETAREHGAEAKRCSDAGHARGPSEAIEDQSEHGAAREAAEEIA